MSHSRFALSGLGLPAVCLATALALALAMTTALSTALQCLAVVGPFVRGGRHQVSSSESASAGMR